MIEMDTRLATAFAKRLDNDYAAIAELTESNIKFRAENARLRAALEVIASQEQPQCIFCVNAAREALK